MESGQSGHLLTEKPPTGKKMKARAPPPPKQPGSSWTEDMPGHTEDSSSLVDQSPADMKENLLHRTVDILVNLPNGTEKNTTVNGRKAVLDLLVDLCSQYHLNPTHHTLELYSRVTQQTLSFKPNTLFGMLDVNRVVIKEKIQEEKLRRPPPSVPEKSVRLVVNFLRTQKAVIRVSPGTPVYHLIPAICEKCDLKKDHVILLKDSSGKEELDISKSLNELGLRELYALDTSRETSRNSSISSDLTDKERKGLTSFFKLNMRKNKGFSTAPSSPSANSRTSTLTTSRSLGNISHVLVQSDVKKRRAPPPPSLTTDQSQDRDQITLHASQIVSAALTEAQQKKRRAPPPPSPTPELKVEERESNRHSTIGIGRHVPQKPPRGTTRDPPQLTIPPPPPYPPSLEGEFMDVSPFESDSYITENKDWSPKSEQMSIHGSSLESRVVARTLLDKDKMMSRLKRYSASEDSTEDSGFVSLPSEDASSISQSESQRLNEELVLDQISVEMDTDVTYRATLCSTNDLSFSSEEGASQWELQNRAQHEEDHRNEKRREDCDQFITAQFHQTLPDLDADLEEQGMNYKGDTNHHPVKVNDGPSSRNFERQPSIGMVIAFPVTVVDEPPEFHSYSISRHENILQANPSNRLQAQTDKGLLNNTFTNKNNNACKPSDKQVESAAYFQSPIANRANAACSIFSQSRRRDEEEVSCPTAEVVKSHQQVFKDPDIPNEEVSYVKYAPQNTSSRIQSIMMKNSNDSNTERFGFSEEHHSVGMQPNESQEYRSLMAKENKHEVSDQMPALANWQTTDSNISSYAEKQGMKTFKVIPPKPVVKDYLREGASISAGAIKIDNQGNFINPVIAVNKQTSSASSNEENTWAGSVKVSQNMKSSRRHSEISDDTAPEGSEFTLDHKTTHNPSLSENQSSAKLHSTSIQPEVYVISKSSLPVHEIRPSVSTVQIQKMMPSGPSATATYFKPEPSFLKPSKKTSSQFLASTLAKHIAINRAKAASMENLTTEKAEADNSINFDILPKPKDDNYNTETKPSTEKFQKSAIKDYTTNVKAHTHTEVQSRSFTPSMDGSFVENSVSAFRTQKEIKPVSLYIKPQSSYHFPKQDSSVEEQSYMGKQIMSVSDLPLSSANKTEKSSDSNFQPVSPSVAPSLPFKSVEKQTTSTSTIPFSAYKTEKTNELNFQKIPSSVTSMSFKSVEKQNTPTNTMPGFSTNNTEKNNNINVRQVNSSSVPSFSLKSVEKQNTSTSTMRVLSAHKTEKNNDLNALPVPSSLAPSMSAASVEKQNMSVVNGPTSFVDKIEKYSDLNSQPVLSSQARSSVGRRNASTSEIDVSPAFSIEKSNNELNFQPIPSAPYTVFSKSLEKQHTAAGNTPALFSHTTDKSNSISIQPVAASLAPPLSFKSVGKQNISSSTVSLSSIQNTDKSIDISSQTLPPSATPTTFDKSVENLNTSTSNILVFSTNKNEKSDNLKFQPVSSSATLPVSHKFSESSFSSFKYSSSLSQEKDASQSNLYHSKGSSMQVRGRPEVLKNTDDSDSSNLNPSNVLAQSGIFGPVKKFKPVVQKPLQAEVCLHSALMDSIRTAGGKEKLRKIENLNNGSEKKPAYVETENEHTALLSAIRAQTNMQRLKKTSSAASEELQNIRNAECSKPDNMNHLGKQLPPHISPPPPPPVAPPPQPITSSTLLKDKKQTSIRAAEPVDARQALMDAIRSGTGAAKLKKVTTSSNTAPFLGVVKSDESSSY
ncbi:protein cordon-bleu isoform X2 [Protopterus annectens]|uniref:protein cordon-bleu isoform X2 n=1 Tax=Protopterus annectens TaxID=7888 RepID=UPI001CFA85F2|nr:protein cordon-bleu isoform X2 [Protopterus annectens]